MTLESLVLSVLASMPKDATIDDFIEELKLERDLDEAEADIASGRIHSQEEVAEMVATWSKQYALRAKQAGQNPAR